ncbi:hypothetical protein ES703_21100 [subsurface metagenome]
MQVYTPYFYYSLEHLFCQLPSIGMSPEACQLGFLFQAHSITNVGDIDDDKNRQEVLKWSSIKPVPGILN